MHFLTFYISQTLFHNLKVTNTNTKVTKFILLQENLNQTNYNEFAIGHALVLCQFDWPQEDEFIPPLMEKIRQHGSFHYPLFQVSCCFYDKN